MANSYGPQSIVQDGLVVCLDFLNPFCYTEGATSATNLGTGTLTATIPAAWSTADGHMKCTGTAATITLSSPNVDVTTGQTYEVWTKGNTAQFGLIEGETSGGAAMAEGVQIHFYQTPAGNAYIRGSAAGPAYDTGDIITPDEWINLTVIFQANDSGGAGGSANCIVYKNGVLHGNGDVANIVVPTNTIKLGDPYSLTDDYLDIWRVYHRELTAAEILQNYNATKNRFQ